MTYVQYIIIDCAYIPLIHGQDIAPDNIIFLLTEMLRHNTVFSHPISNILLSWIIVVDRFVCLIFNSMRFCCIFFVNKRKRECDRNPYKQLCPMYSS